ncbi:MAG TPA: hypothetical protein VIS96_00025, partial [Terrimicrobiaceae bacterium]
MNQKPFRFVHRFFFVSLLGTAGLLNEPLYPADELEQFKTQKIAPDIIIPEKLGQQYFSRHSVISDDFRMLESAQEEEARENVEAQLNAANDQLRRAQKVFREAEERLQAAPVEGAQEATTAKNDAKAARDEAQNRVNETKDAKSKIEQLKRIPLQQLGPSGISVGFLPGFRGRLDRASVKATACSQTGSSVLAPAPELFPYGAP